MIHLAQRMACVHSDIRGPLYREALRMQQQGIPVMKLNTGNPAAFGFPLPESIRTALEGRAEEGVPYCDFQGMPAARQAIVRYCLRKGIEDIEPEDVFIGNGVSEVVNFALMPLLDPGDEVLVPTPNYTLWSNTVRLCGATPVYYRCDEAAGWNPDVNDLCSKITARTRAMVIINPNNPTGALMSKELLEEIVAIARGVGAYLLCDEVYRHLTQEDVWSESVADLYEKGISVGSMSKVFSLAGIRMGWVATRDEDALRAFLSHRDYDLISCGIFDDAIASLALRHTDAMLRRNQGIVRENLAILDAWVAAHPHFFYTRPQAGTTALVYYDFDIPSYEFCKRLYHETGAFVTPGDCFEQPHSMRIGYACDRKTLTDGLAALAAFAENL